MDKFIKNNPSSDQLTHDPVLDSLQRTDSK